MNRFREQPLSPVEFTDVTIDDGFWQPRLETLCDVTIDGVYEHLAESGRIENLRIAAGEVDGAYNPPRYNDSDVFKWVEGACYVLAFAADPTLRERIDEVVDAIEAAQAPDGYLDSYYQVERPDDRWQNLGQGHELYNAGHLIEAALAHHHVTGETRLLDVARRFADHVDERFGPDDETVPGHPEIELALVKLARETGERRYLDLASAFVDRRGHTDRLRWEHDHPDEVGWFGDPDEAGKYDPTYFQDHVPVREQEAVEGHAVRATYLFAGATDVAVESDDSALFAAMERLWENMTTRRMYVTGGIGSSAQGERFTEDYDLPNESSYAETCASIGSVLWTHRLLAATGEGRFGDIIERTLFNAFLAGYALNGEHFFYANPHEVTDPDDPPTRQEWFETACCPTNVPRLLGSLGRYCYLRTDDASEVYVHQYVASTAAVSDDLTLHLDTDYPWDGAISIDVEAEEPTAFALTLRIPGWCRSFDLTVDGDAVEAAVDDGFVRIERIWTGGERVDLDLAMPVERVVAHPAVTEDVGRVALRRGPLVYCLEGVDHDRPLVHYAVANGADVSVKPADDLFDGIAVLEGPATVPALDGWDCRLYRPGDETATGSASVTAVPYYAWGHRGPGEMQVWLRRAE